MLRPNCGGWLGGQNRRPPQRLTALRLDRHLEAPNPFGAQLIVRHHAQRVSLTPLGHRLLTSARSPRRQETERRQHGEGVGEITSGALALVCIVFIRATNKRFAIFFVEP